MDILPDWYDEWTTKDEDGITSGIKENAPEKVKKEWIEWKKKRKNKKGKV